MSAAEVVIGRAMWETVDAASCMACRQEPDRINLQSNVKFMRPRSSTFPEEQGSDAATKIWGNGSWEERVLTVNMRAAGGFLCMR